MWFLGARADRRRNSEVLYTPKSLDDLEEHLKAKGFAISRSTAYLRVIPRRMDTTEGKRHVRTVPVKVMRPKKELRCGRVDSRFAASTVGSLKSLAGVNRPILNKPLAVINLSSQLVF